MPKNRKPGRRERLEAGLQAAAKAGDVIAWTKLQHVRADRLMAVAERTARKEHLRRWSLGSELSRPPLVPEYAPINAVWIELPQKRDVYPCLSHYHQPGYDSRVQDAQIRRDHSQSTEQAAGIILMPHPRRWRPTVQDAGEKENNESKVTSRMTTDTD